MRIGIVGCGQIARVHAGFILADRRHTVVGVCDEEQSRANAFAEAFGIAKAYGALADLLEQERPDVVHVVTPPQSHARLALQAVRSRCHVLVEKPMALSLSDADALIGAAREAGVKLCVDHNQLFDPPMIEARRLLADGVLGTVVGVESYYGFNVAQTGERRWVGELPGGVFQNLAPHPIYMMLPFVGETVDVHAATLATGALGRDLPDELRAVVRGTQALGHLSISLGARPYLNFLRLYGSKAIMHVDVANMIVSMERLRNLPKAAARGLMTVEQGAQLALGTVRNAFKLVSGRLKPYQGVGNLIRAFYDSIERDAEPPVTGEAGRRVVDVFERIRQQIQTAPSRPRPTRRTPADRPTVFVTGGSGFLGSHLISGLRDRGVAVRALVRQTSRIDHLRSLDVDWVDGSLADSGRLEAAINGCDVVYHCAAAMRGPWSDYVSSTIQGTERLLQASAAAGVRRFVHVSSLSVYGVSELEDGAVVTEDAAYDPQPESRGFYSRSKIDAERLVLAYGRDRRLPITILRPGTIYGPRGKIFFPRIGWSFRNKLFVIIGSGGNLLPLAYVTNVVDAICLAGTRAEALGEIYNIVDDDPITQREYLDELIQRTGIRAVTVHVPFRAAYLAAAIRDAQVTMFKSEGAAARYRLRSATRDVRYDTSKAKQQLAWTPNVSLEEGMRRTFDWYNGERAYRQSTEPAPVAIVSNPALR